jgi:hypothetical protein
MWPEMKTYLSLAVCALLLVGCQGKVDIELSKAGLPMANSKFILQLVSGEKEQNINGVTDSKGRASISYSNDPGEELYLFFIEEPGAPPLKISTGLLGDRNVRSQWNLDPYELSID